MKNEITNHAVDCLRGTSTREITYEKCSKGEKPDPCTPYSVSVQPSYKPRYKSRGLAETEYITTPSASGEIIKF